MWLLLDKRPVSENLHLRDETFIREGGSAVRVSYSYFPEQLRIELKTKEQQFSGRTVSVTAINNGNYGPPEGQPTPTPVQQQLKKRRTIISIASTVFGLVVFALVYWGLHAIFDGPSKQDQIEKAVSQLMPSLPKQVDNVTTLTDVKAEPSTIHYIYSISASVDPASITKSELSKAVLPNVCSIKDTKDILDADVTIKYSYSFVNSPTKIDLSFTKADCS